MPTPCGSENMGTGGAVVGRVAGWLCGASSVHSALSQTLRSVRMLIFVMCLSRYSSVLSNGFSKDQISYMVIKAR